MSLKGIVRHAAVFSLVLVSSLALAADARKFELDGNRLIVPSPVVYETGKDVILPESDAALMHVKAFLEAKEYITMMRIEVHTDTTGSTAANQGMSEKRALAVAKWLVAKGVDCKRLLPVGFGESKPVADNSTAEGKAANRRTEFINAAIKGRPIGGMPIDGGGVVAGDPCEK